MLFANDTADSQGQTVWQILCTWGVLDGSRYWWVVCRFSVEIRRKIRASDSCFNVKKVSSFSVRIREADVRVTVVSVREELEEGLFAIGHSGIQNYYTFFFEGHFVIKCPCHLLAKVKILEILVYLLEK